MTKLVTKLNKSRYFRFFASVQLAVPLMLALLCVVAAATLIESKYNSEYARLMVYDTAWFEALLGLLWLNIFLATVSRYPFKIRHTGFVIVHLGLLTLLIGGAITKHAGIDGQLRVVEKGKESAVMLDRLVLELIDVQADSAIKAPFSRTAARLSGSALGFLNDRFNAKITAREYLPFAEVRDGFESSPESAGEGPVALGFGLKSPFFDVTEWLHSEDRAELKMGPATLRLVIDREGAKSKPAVRALAKTPAKKIKKIAPGKGSLLVLDGQSRSLLAEIPVERLAPGLKLPKGLILASAKLYSHAVVVQNHLAEGDTPGGNPAVELQIKSGETVTREVSYAKFPEFSLAQSKGTPLGLKFEYRAGDVSSSDEKPPEPSADRNGNVIEFHVSEKGGDAVDTRLFKNGEQVGGSVLRAGENLVTPWMGIKITLAGLKRGAVRKSQALPAEITPRAELPAPALFVTPAGAGSEQGFWLAEGQFRQIEILGRQYEVYFGRENMRLPFAIELLEFKKVDYPGTETPMSFESRVRINGLEPEQVVSMNEPLKHAGFTLYQSSYDLRPGAPTASIFSVNRDPGRGIKYAGSVILAIGIIVFTLMRSRLYRKYFGPLK